MSAFHQRAISAVCSFIKVLICMNKTLSGCLRELNTKEKVQLGNPKNGRSRILKRSLTRAFQYKVLSHSSNGFHKVGPN